jgi:hypothetical protein
MWTKTDCMTSSVNGTMCIRVVVEGWVLVKL